MKKLKYLLFIIPFLFSFNVFALNTNVSSKIKYDTDTSSGTYKGDEIELGGYNGQFNVGTRYNGKLSLIDFYLSSNDYNFTSEHTYTITLNMATNDWRNNFMAPQVIKANSDGSFQTVNQNLVVSNFRFISRKQIKFDFKTNSTLSPYLFFRLYSTDYATSNSVAITGDNNWLLSSIYIDDNTSSGGSGNTGSGSSITNTTLICSNGLSLSTKNFTDSDITVSNSYLNSSASLVSNTGYGVIAYIPISSNTDYVIKKTTSTGDVPSFCLSSSNTSYGSCTAYNQRNSIAFNSGSSTFLSISIRTGETVTLGKCVSPIDNANSNTDDIINNQNQNTQDIINNQNENTEKAIESQQICNVIDSSSIIKSKTALNSSGVEFTTGGSYWGVTDYINVSNSIVKVLPLSNSFTGIYTCFYSSSKTLISCATSSSFSSGVLTLPNNTFYFRTTINTQNDRPIFTICKNGNQSINDSITDSNVESGTGTGFFDNFTSQDFGLSQIITIPLNTIQSLTSKSCVPLQVPIPFTNSNVSLPCMTEIYETKFPSIYNLWKIVSFGIVAYLIAIDIFHIVKGFKDPESDKVEVLDL